MGAEWEERSLGELIDIKHGFAFSGEHIHDEPRSDILLTPGNFAIGGGFKADKFKYFDGDVPNDYVLSKGDLLVTMTDLSKQGDTLGYPAILPNHTGRRYLHNQRIGKVILKADDEVDERFLFYLLRSREYRHEILASATGTTVKHTSPRRILAHKAKFPPLPEQKAIAAVLGALDDKIELNRRMNATLEAMARALFQSWFVDFDPVRAKLDGRQPTGLDPTTAALFPNEFEDSELGPIPKGWRVGKLGEVATNPRRTVRPNEIAPNTPYIALEHMPRRSVALSDWSDSADVTSGKFSFRKGEILFGKLRPYFHKVGVAPLDGVCSTDILVIAPSTAEWFGFVLGHSSSTELVNFTDLASTGTKMPRTNWSDIASFAVAVPPVELAAAFTHIIEPLIQLIIGNSHASRTLAGMRDALLPKLLSGELRVGTQEKLEVA
jgi:type I restriction enzyme S subunit